MFFFDLTGGSSGQFSYTLVTENFYDVQLSDYVVSIDNDNNNWFVNLPDPAGIEGKVYVVKRVDNSSTGTIIVQSVSGMVQTNNGSFASQTDLNNWGAFDDKKMFMSNGTNWENIK